MGARTVWATTACVLALVAPAFLAGTAGAATTGGPAPLVRLSGSALGLPAGAAVLGPTAASTRITVDVSLRPRDAAALAAFVRAVSTPGSPRYHRYLPAGQLAATFGPTAATLGAVRSWLTSTGLSVGPTSRDGLLIPVTATAGRLQQVLATPLVQARLADGRTARLSTRDPAVPAALASRLQGVIGLSDLAVASPHLVPSRLGGGVPSPAALAPASAGPQACAAAADFSPQARTATQLASTYGLSTLFGAGRSGTGQSVGIFELEPFTPSDISAYEACFGLHVPVSTVTVDGGTGAVQQQGEAALDIEVVAGLAPGAAIQVYAGPNDGGTGVMDTYDRMVSDDTSKVLSTSWGACEADQSPGDQQAEATLFAAAAAQGQTVLAASGDSGSSDCSISGGGPFELAVDDPAAQPDVTGVGGTSLTSAAPDAPTESVWNDTPFGQLDAGGGGNSTTFVAPTWQQVPAARSGNTSFSCGSTAPFNQQCREVPDVSASADPNHGDVVFFEGGWHPFGGTSQAAPMWAALVADTNQGCAAPAGLLGPALYGSGASAAFHDVTTGNNNIVGQPSMFPAAAGYDLASGWGSPNATALLGLLSGAPSGCPVVTGLSPSSGPATGGATVVISGSGFGAAPSVTFGGVPATVVSADPGGTSITVQAPADGPGTVQVAVTATGAAAGTSPASAASAFTFFAPKVTSVTPSHGPVGGGGTVTIAGSGFSQVSSVTFGAAPATHVQVNSLGSITATVPPGPAQGATVDVVVHAAAGASPTGPADRYTYALPGYWMVASDGGIFAFGHAGFFGSTGALVLTRPVVGMARTPDDRGYWLVASDGGIFAFGDAGFFGSTGGQTLTRPIVAITATPDGRGYWLVASDGGIFAFGDAGFFGSTGAIVLNKPITGMAATPDGKGYWLVASDGGIFAFGDAAFHGSTGGIALNRPIVAMGVDLTGDGYWLVASDGGVFAFGSAPFLGSTGAIALHEPVNGMAAT
jgi:subtilase family serine protease